MTCATSLMDADGIDNGGPRPGKVPTTATPRSSSPNAMTAPVARASPMSALGTRALSRSEIPMIAKTPSRCSMGRD
jgi:hypothetical protein